MTYPAGQTVPIHPTVLHPSRWHSVLPVNQIFGALFWLRNTRFVIVM